MKILCIMNNDRRHDSIQPVGCILYKKDNGIILANTIIKDIEDSVDLLNEPMIFNNEYLSPSNIYVTYDLAFLVILLGKNIHLLIGVSKCKLPSKYWKLSDHCMGNKWTIESLKLMLQSGKKMLNV